MKALYYLEFAKSMNDNQIIPAHEMKWYTSRMHKLAYEDPDLCDITRIDIQKTLSDHIVRVSKMGWFKNLLIRFSKLFDFVDWVVVEG